MIKILDHPLIKIKLTVMRDKKTDYVSFRKNLGEVASLMVYEIMRDYKGKTKKVSTPTNSIAKGLDFDREIVLIPILRAGLGMVDSITSLVPEAKVGHIGLYRDEKTFEIKEYFNKLPKVNKNAQIFILDPMLATGNSIVSAIDILKKNKFQNISIVSIVGTKEGINNINKVHKNVKIFLAALDDKLDKNKYIIPGLGDAGDRLFGTK